MPAAASLAAPHNASKTGITEYDRPCHAAPAEERRNQTMSADQRMSIYDVAPKAYESMFAMEKSVKSGGLDEVLLALVKMRASQLNGCAYCLDMHAREGREAGIDQRMLDVLSGWREAPGLYTERQQAAIALTEEMTLIGEAGVSDAVWSRVTSAFTEQELVSLLMAISAINVWNRLAVTTHQSLPEASV
jgi:AhpD family alkylhydroperoxidase